MHLLVIGGTRFAGRAMVEEALARGHRVTLFNRGQTGPDLFPDAEHVRGDRDGGLAPLEGRSFDAVIDTYGYVPRVVRASAELLAGNADHYTFISSISVYPDGTPPGSNEGAPVGTIEDPAVEEITDTTYGPLKALCEAEVRRAFPERALQVRCGLIVGPHDYTDRFTYWPARMARGGEVLAPLPQDQPVQVIDARDLGAWVVRGVEAGLAGAFNTTRPERPHTMASVLETCREVAGSDAEITWVDPGFLLDQGVEPWSEVPLWLPKPEDAGVLAVDVGRAVAAGLTFRPLADTVHDTLAWHAARPEGEALKAGLDPEREGEVLRVWHATRGA